MPNALSSVIPTKGCCVMPTSDPDGTCAGGGFNPGATFGTGGNDGIGAGVGMTAAAAAIRTANTTCIVYCTRTEVTTDMPGRSGYFCGSASSTEIFTGMRCVTLTKFPVAFC